jgi:membrane protease YdiL (CAAX protease family)
MTDTEVKNPFLSLRSRSLLLWGLVGIVALEILAWGEPVVVQYGVYAVLLLWSGWQIRRLGISVPRLVGTLSRDSVWIPTIAVVVPLIMLFSFGSGLLFFGLLTRAAPSVAQSLGEAFSIPMSWVLLVVVAPPVEELVFRGILLHRWSVKWGLTKAVIFSSLAFAMLHANPMGMFVFGCVMAVLYIRSRTLIVPMVCHALNNAVALTLSQSPTLKASSITSFIPWAAVCTAVSGVCVWYFLRRNWAGPDWCAPYFVERYRPASAESIEAGCPEAEHAPGHPAPLADQPPAVGELPPVGL